MDEISEILSHMNDNGLTPERIIPDGKIHKFKIDPKDSKISGWYKAYQNFSSNSGEIFYVVLYGNWREGSQYKYHSGNVKFCKEDRANMKAQIAKAKKEVETEKKLMNEKIAEETIKQLSDLSDEGYSEYLKKKKVDKCDSMNIKYDYNGNIFIPMRDIDSKLWSLQKITPMGTKRYKGGGKVQNCFHTLGNIDEDTPLYLTEGFATGAAIRMATKETVIVTFTADNLTKVAKLIRKKYSDRDIIICGDEDKFKVNKNTGNIDNPGRKKAEQAAKESLGELIFPVFKDESTKPTDFADLLLLESLEAVKKQLNINPKPKLALYALGFREAEYFFTSSENRQIVPVISFTERDFLNLMPLRYWEALYLNEQGKIDWSMAKSELMENCRSRGLFDGYNVRGAGVWIDELRLVVNMGDYLIVDGKKIQLGNIKSRYFYTLGKTLKTLNKNPLSSSDCKTLINCCNGFNWRRPDSGILLGGVLVLSRVCGAIPNRPHMWITGGAETGKTSLLEKLIKPILGDSCMYVQKGTTEAGVRQTLKANSLPVIFDEFEISGGKGDETIHSLLELMRGAWSDSSAQIIKGGAGGNASAYLARFSAIVSSIRTKLTETADKGRFTVLELAPHGNDVDHWTKLSRELHLIDSRYSERLFARTIKLLPVIFKNLKVMKKALSETGGARFSDQYGIILAAYAILIQDNPITFDEAKWFVGQVNLEVEKEVTKEADHVNAMDHLLSTTLTYESHLGRKEDLIGELITGILKTNSDYGMEDQKKALSLIGVRIESKYVAIATPNHAEMEKKIWRNTKWSESWGILSRLNGAARKKMKVMGKSKWCITIPREFFDEQQKLSF